MFRVLLGVEHVGGDMLENVPEGDAIFMKVSFTLLPSQGRFMFNYIPVHAHAVDSS